MPIRIEHDGDLERWRVRQLVPLLVCAVSIAGFSCSGSSSCPPATSGPSNPPTPLLQPRYALSAVTGAPLPYVVSNAGGTRVRLLADTLAFTGAGSPPAASGTYTETQVIGTQVGTAAETVTRTTSSPRAWSRTTTYATLTLSGFVGVTPGGAAAQASMALGAADVPTAQAFVTVPNATYYAFVPLP